MIRKAKLVDNVQINKIGLLVNKDYGKLFSLKKIVESDIEFIYVYEKDNIIVGFIHIIELEDDVEIINIVVRTDYRNQNIGSELINYIIQKKKNITLEVAIDNKEALSLYEKYNFKIIRIRKKYYQDKDAYLMGREIWKMFTYWE